MTEKEPPFRKRHLKAARELIVKFRPDLQDCRPLETIICMILDNDINTPNEKQNQILHAMGIDHLQVVEEGEAFKKVFVAKNIAHDLQKLKNNLQEYGLIQ
ncbi:MAG: hypothetical protein MI862_18795 [Desulfobacterales bacterium]|nr:hypothetical protein [Desulfobacterales bacterium]